jgi:hypothetical protein
MAEDERRNSARQRTVMRGCIYYDKRSAAADCLVRDVSDSGARLELSANVVIPDLIELYIPKREETHHARVLWRHDNEIGVAYVESGSDHGAYDLKAPAARGHTSAELEDRVRKLEAEIVSFRQAIKTLLEDVKNRSLRLPL